MNSLLDKKRPEGFIEPLKPIFKTFGTVYSTTEKSFLTGLEG